jgi:type IV pilus assembly protein PilA
MLTLVQQQVRLWDETAGESGFTLVELLVVMLIITILAAVAIPAFGEQTKKAVDARAEETAHTATVAMETCMIESGGLYGNCDVKALRAIEPTLPESPTLKVSVPQKGTSYTITVRSEPKSQTFKVKRSAKGVFTFPCTTKGIGACPTTGAWG